MFILHLFLFLPSFLFLASLVVVGIGEYFVDLLLEFGMVVVAFDRLPVLEVQDVHGSVAVGVVAAAVLPVF
jgi:hypothetical protein